MICSAPGLFNSIHNSLQASLYNQVVGGDQETGIGYMMEIDDVDDNI